MALIGLQRRGTIEKYNNDGTVNIRLDDTHDLQSDAGYLSNLTLPLAYSGPEGQMIVGYPEVGTPVFCAYAQGEWVISGYAKPDGVYNGGSISSRAGGDVTGDLKPNRILLQTKLAANRLFLDTEEISFGRPEKNVSIDTVLNNYTSNFDGHYTFDSAARKISGFIKRDIKNNSLFGIDVSAVTDPKYDDNLYTVGMDNSTDFSILTKGSKYRNLPLVEERCISYEFPYLESNLGFETDKKEADKYNKTFQPELSSTSIKQQSRATSFSLNLHRPNQIIEEIKGTGVDSLSNILDLNRDIIPFGLNDEDSFIKNPDAKDAFRRIRNLHRKSIAYHFEINARKSGRPVNGSIDEIFEVPRYDDPSEMSRSRSTFFVDVDKEGQFKINVPASSEIGNIPLHTRYINASVIAYDKDSITDPNEFLSLDKRKELFGDNSERDIFLEDYSNYKGSIKIIGGDGEVGPIDINEESPIRLGTAFHNFYDSFFQFLTDRIDEDSGGTLYRYMPNLGLNQRPKEDLFFDNFVQDEIKVSGDDANAGGRSGSINLDGFVSMSVGANTVDRQSLWLDTAGGIVSMIGRDKRDISCALSLDGHLIINVGGTTPTGKNDKRFIKEYDSFVPGIVDIRVQGPAGLSTIRIDSKGVTVATPGRMELASQGDLLLRSNTNILMEAPNIGFYPDSSPRFIKRSAAPEVA